MTNLETITIKDADFSSFIERLRNVSENEKPIILIQEYAYDQLMEVGVELEASLEFCGKFSHYPFQKIQIGKDYLWITEMNPACLNPFRMILMLGDEHGNKKSFTDSYECNLIIVCELISE